MVGSGFAGRGAAEGQHVEQQELTESSSSEREEVERKEELAEEKVVADESHERESVGIGIAMGPVLGMRMGLEGWVSAGRPWSRVAALAVMFEQSNGVQGKERGR